MTRSDLLRAAELSRSAMDAATISASFDRINPAKANDYADRAEEALYAALDALAQARMGRSSFLPLAAEIVFSALPERKVA